MRALEDHVIKIKDVNTGFLANRFLVIETVSNWFSVLLSFIEI